MNTTTADRPSPDIEPCRQDAIVVHGLRCSYGHFEAVRGIDLVVPRGELVALLGTNGAGKTTVLDVLQGRRPRSAGDVRVLGQDPAVARRRLASRTGVMLQGEALPPDLPPAEFLRLWARLVGVDPTDAVDELLTRVGLAHRRDVLVRQLSGGERRRLDLAAALVGQPELLFLDEPTTGLDPESRSDTWKLVSDLVRRGATIVLTTHHIEEAEALADRVVVLHRGRVELAGTLDDVQAAGRSRVRCRLPTDVAPPEGFDGDVHVTRHPGHLDLEVVTDHVDRDLGHLLEWARRHDLHLDGLTADQPALGDVFHRLRADSEEMQ